MLGATQPSHRGERIAPKGTSRSGAGCVTAGFSERDCRGFDVAVITVPTPPRDGVPDLSYIEASARTLGPHLRPGARPPGLELEGDVLAEFTARLRHQNGVRMRTPRFWGG